MTAQVRCREGLDAMARHSAKVVLERLKVGNARFQDDRLRHSGRDHSRRQELLAGQTPAAIILTCADSRVVPEIVFDTGLGELFVVRVAGNVANTSTIASIEYAVAHLGSKLIVVMGHESCGAVTAALAEDDGGRNLDHLLGHVSPAIASADDSDVDLVARRNANLQAEALIRKSDIIRKAVESDGLQIVSAFYLLGTGAVEFD
jgi:carbonic anhydrase